MAGVKVSVALVLVVLISISFKGKEVSAQVHHVVGFDRGWDPDSDINSWLSGRLFRVGDKIWFTYSAAQESVLELQSLEDFLTCDLANPIRTYTDGLNHISLDREGIRYFTSGNPISCKNGLKLHLNVQPPEKNESRNTTFAIATAPTSPSVSTKLNQLTYLLFFGLLHSYIV
ncbi:mavicyanin-like isoform X1 [Olea europaea subsp. europaea]|uniref:Mavicyanin-like isoform X1 n=1 Tax=Olea europaea subsp. europaea TaxID=158383 RepID=A0A8S0SJX7_OLEEU|nr:mavicyanin-like isoform X1 [Olea europaea subsp. europaea]